MRSRYTAYVKEDEAYLLATWHPDSRPSELRFDPDQQWLGLKIKKHLPGAGPNKVSQVEFVARFRLHGRVARLHEKSRFRLKDGRWYYLDGKLISKK